MDDERHRELRLCILGLQFANQIKSLLSNRIRRIGPIGFFLLSVEGFEGSEEQFEEEYWGRSLESPRVATTAQSVIVSLKLHWLLSCIGNRPLQQLKQLTTDVRALVATIAPMASVQRLVKDDVSAYKCSFDLTSDRSWIIWSTFIPPWLMFCCQISVNWALCAVTCAQLWAVLCAVSCELKAVCAVCCCALSVCELWARN